MKKVFSHIVDCLSSKYVTAMLTVLAFFLLGMVYAVAMMPYV